MKNFKMLFFIITFLYLSSVVIFADTITGTFEYDNIYSEDDLISKPFYSIIPINNGTSTTTGSNISGVETDVRTHVREGVKGSIDSDYGNVITNTVKFEYYTPYNNDGLSSSVTQSPERTTKVSSVYNITDVLQSAQEEAFTQEDGFFITITFEIGSGGTKVYNIKAKGFNFYYTEPYTVKIDGVEVTRYRILSQTYDYRYRNEMSSETWLHYWNNAQNAITGFTYVQNSARGMVMAAMVGYGFNVGSMYSTRQVPLSDAMEKIGNGYEFVKSAIFKQSFAYYMHPILGRLELNEEERKTYCNGSATIVDWRNMAQRENYGFTNYSASIVINKDFKTFIESLDLTGESMSSNGLKVSKTDNLLTDGVKRANIPNTSDFPNPMPKVVISYMVEMAFPYIFAEVGNSYRMNSVSVRVEDGFEYCLYNDIIYKKGDYSEKGTVTDRSALKIGRDKLYLYNVLTSTDGSTRKGILIFGEYEEAVVDTTTGSNNGRLYATGRKIGFKNAYSDKLNINIANPEIMYVENDSNAHIGYLPKNVLFLPTDAEREISESNYLLDPEALRQGKKEFQLLDSNMYSYEEMQNQISDMNNHISFENNPKFVKLWISFTQVTNYTGVDSLSESDQNDAEKIAAAGLSHYGVFIIRNNRYVDDSDLISWLASDTAKATAYVDDVGLLALITGDFRNNLKKLSYADWKRMQEIKSDLQASKDNFFVRIFNVASIVFGTFLIIFAILMCLFYWIDIFNTFTNFSFLNFVSMQRLYPVEHKDLIPVNAGDNVKYVDFKDVLIIAFICVAFGILFLEVTSIIRLIVQVYNYLIYIGGVKK